MGRDEPRVKVSNQSKTTDGAVTGRASRKPRRRAADSVPPDAGDDLVLLHVGKQVLAARQRLGLTQEQLAEKAGCAPATVFLVENARRNATIRSLSVLAAALDVDVADLFPRSKVANSKSRATLIAKTVAEEVGRAREALSRIEHLAHQMDKTGEE